MKTETPELITLEHSTLTCWSAFQVFAVAVGAVGKLTRQTFHRIRKTRSILKAIYDEREDGLRLIAEKYVVKDAMGKPTRTDDGMDFVWIPKTEAEGRARLADVNGEMRTIQVAPILWDELLPEDDDVANANALFALADWGFVVEE